MTRILLMGLMGVGKTTVGRLLAAALEWPWLDNDEVVTEIAGASKQTLVRERGEPGLRAAEAQALRYLLGRTGPYVAGAPAGVVDDPHLYALVASAPSDVFVVWLRADPVTLAGRLHRDPEDRPWIDGDVEGVLAKMAAVRNPRYAELAHLVVDVAGRAPENITKTILAELVTQ